MDTYAIEYTDTFGGEANYSWVRRWKVTAKTELAAIREAKRLAGLSGIPCRKDNYYGQIAFYPRGFCTVLFVSADENY